MQNSDGPETTFAGYLLAARNALPVVWPYFNARPSQETTEVQGLYVKARERSHKNLVGNLMTTHDQSMHLLIDSVLSLNFKMRIQGQVTQVVLA